jgi:hypothetical protein
MKPLFDLYSLKNASRYPSPKTSAKLCRIEQSLKNAFPKFEQDHEYPYASGGEWATHNLIDHMLQTTGPCHLYAATWSVAEHAATRIAAMIDAGLFLSVHFLVDWRVQVRTPSFLAIARSNFSDCRVTSCHAKCFVLQNDAWSVSCVGSANFTNNPRIEAGHISTQKKTAIFHRDWILAEIKNAAPFGVDMRKAGKPDGRK